MLGYRNEGLAASALDFPFLILARFGDGYMITVRTKSSLNVKEVVRFFNRNFPEAVLKVRFILVGKGPRAPLVASPALNV